MPLLSIRDYRLSIAGTEILKGIDLELDRGEILGLVGESGSGKSMTALSIMQLLPRGSVSSGQVLFGDRDLTGLSEDQLCDIRGRDIGMVFQEPMTALNPLQTIGDQVTEGIRVHGGTTRVDAWKRAEEILERVGLPANRVPPGRYPHELSGGQRQRVGIAIACALKPKLLIADEPTTALDVTIQAQILDLLRDLVRETGMGLMLISHDLGVVADMADSIAIMRRGEILEKGGALDVLTHRRHPYTAGLAEASTHHPPRASEPVLHETAKHRGDTPLLNVRDLVVEYPVRRTSLFTKPSPFRAVDKVSFEIFEGQTMALVGESGCGKSTLARSLLGLQAPASGEIEFEGVDLASADARNSRSARKEMQIVFQDPYGSFNPRHRVERLLAEPLFRETGLSRADKRKRVQESLQAVALSPADSKKYIHEFSGGQRQRLAIARALVSRPRLIIADEPVSALDVSIRAQILDLLSELRDTLNIAYLFISHDLTVVRALCDEVLIMRGGRIVESGPVKRVFDAPQREYTRELLAAAPDLDASLSRRRETESA